MDLDDYAKTVKFVLRDRDTKFTAAWDAVFTAAGIRTIRSPVQAPRANAIMERWIGSCRREILDRTLLWNQRHLLRVLCEYETHHNEHRPQRSLEQAAPLRPLPEPAGHQAACHVDRHDKVGGVIHEYTRACAARIFDRHCSQCCAECWNPTRRAEAWMSMVSDLDPAAAVVAGGRAHDSNPNDEELRTSNAQICRGGHACGVWELKALSTTAAR